MKISAAAVTKWHDVQLTAFNLVFLQMFDHKVRLQLVID